MKGVKNGQPCPSSVSLASNKTVKGKIFKELFDGGARKNAKTDEEIVLPYGRGGSRKQKKAGPSQPHPVDALIASVANHEKAVKSNSHKQHDSDNLSSISVASSSNISRVSKATVKGALKQILGGGGNDEGSWKDDNFVSPFGRGGAVHPRRRDSESEGSARPLSITSSVDSIGHNPDGLFFFGHAYRPTAAVEGQEIMYVGPGEGIFHPNGRPDGEGGGHIVVPAPSASKASMSMTKSGMSKISVKVAVKEVLGGGGNDHDEWKYIPVFHPSFGRGGNGARVPPKCSPTSPEASHNFRTFPRAGSSLEGHTSYGSTNEHAFSPHSYPRTGLDSDWQESGTGRLETGRPRSSSASRALSLNRVRFRERSTSDPAQTINLDVFREQVQLERRRQALGRRQQPAIIDAQVSGATFYPPVENWVHTGRLHSQESLASNSTVSLTPSDAIDAIRIPPPPLMAPPLPPSSPTRATTPLFQPSPSPSPLVRRGSTPTPRSPRATSYRPPQFQSQRHTSLPVMPSPSHPQASEYTTPLYALPMGSWQAPHSIQSTPRPYLPPLAIGYDPTAPTDQASPTLSSPSGIPSPHGIHYTHVDPNVVIQGLASLAHAQAQELQLAQAQRDVMALEREVLAAEREAFDAELQAAAAKRASLEREKEIIAQERALLEAEKKVLSQRVQGLKKEVNKREKTIKGLTWLVGNLDGSDKSASENSLGVAPDESEADVSPPSDMEEESEPTDDDVGESLSDVLQQVNFGMAR